MKEFMLLIREEATYGDISMEEMQEAIQSHMAWIESLGDRFVGGDPLEPGGLCLKKSGELDGPYMEGKECLSGFYRIRAENLESARVIALTCPELDRGATLELREVMNEY